MYSFVMNATRYEDSLRRILADFSLLDSGWRPGEAELTHARAVEQVRIFPPKNGAPFCMIGGYRILPASCRFIVTSVFAIDVGERWARILDEWVVIEDTLGNSAALDAREIRRSGTAWLCAELQRLPAAVLNTLKSADYSAIGIEIGEQFIELRRTCH